MRKIRVRKIKSILRNATIAAFMGFLFFGKNYFAGSPLPDRVSFGVILIFAVFIELCITDPWYSYLRRRENRIKEKEALKVEFKKAPRRAI